MQIYIFYSVSRISIQSIFKGGSVAQLVGSMNLSMHFYVEGFHLAFGPVGTP